MMKNLTIIFIFFLLFLLLTIENPLNADKDHKRNVFVSILPQRYFVERIVGNLVDVNVMVQPGHSPATYEPTPKQMALLSECDVYFAIGVPFERIWLKKIVSAYPDLLVIETHKNIKRMMIDRHVHHDTSKHGSDESLDPHIWLSPHLVEKQVDAIAEALKRVLPAKRELIASNAESFRKDLQDLDKEIKNILAGLKNRAFMVFHPSWGYFADDYDLKQIPIEHEGKRPSAKYLKWLIDTAKRGKTKAVFVQEQFSKTYAFTVADSIGAKVISIDPLSEDYIDNLKRVAKLLAGDRSR